MKRTHIACSLGLSSIFWYATAFSQSAAAPVVSSAGQLSPPYSVQGTASTLAGQGGGPVSYASVSQLNGLLSQLEDASKATQADLAKARIERWKTDGSTKKQALANVDSIQRNLQGALPEIIGQLRAAPENLSPTFKLYRNLDALYDVLGSVVESAGAFGPKDDFQALSNNLSAFETARRALGERLENLTSAKENEIARLRTDLKAAQAAIPATPPQKTVVDDTQPAKKSAPKKKPVPKKPPTPPPETPPASQQPPPSHQP
jgi:hypothetical protein